MNTIIALGVGRRLNLDQEMNDCCMQRTRTSWRATAGHLVDRILRLVPMQSDSSGVMNVEPSKKVSVKQAVLF
jgi:hypothetical protein